MSTEVIRKMKIVDRFISNSLCKKLVDHMSHLDTGQAWVHTKKSGGAVRTHYRNSLSVRMHKDHTNMIVSRLKEQRPMIEEEFNISLTDIEHPQALIYEKGHFFKPHTDVGNEEHKTSTRKITAVLMLNSSNKVGVGVKENEGFSGGDFLAYGIFDSMPNTGIPIRAVQGRLVLFRSDMMHEVRPLLGGRKYSIVSWYS